jgi:hypothetical protein
MEKIESKINKGRPTEKKIVTVVVYRKSTTSKKNFLLITEEGVDEVITTLKRKPLLPSNYDILDIGVGESFIEVYKKQYNIK